MTEKGILNPGSQSPKPNYSDTHKTIAKALREIIEEIQKARKDLARARSKSFSRKSYWPS
jgi:hypothetical protein